MMGTLVRGKILRSDLAGYDGKTVTATRVDSTGGTITGLVADYEVDALALYGASANRTVGTLNSAITQIGTSNATIVLAPGTWTIDSNVTIPSNINIRMPAGAKVSVDNGITLTVAGKVFADVPTDLYIGAGTVTVSNAGSHFGIWWRTAAEASASVSPSDLTFPPGNVLRYGTNTTPGTTDMSAAIQAACDSNEYVYIPSGSYLIGTEVTMQDGQKVVGDGMDATILIGTSAGHGTSTGLLYANSGSSSTFLSGITISDIGFDGKSTTHSFSEFQHLLSLHGVKNAVVRNCKFYDSRGDGILIGSGNIGGHERHNHNVVISGCVFDGGSGDNRNAISVIDCDGIVIESCHFFGYTRSNMPGAIDFEPDANIFHVMRNCIVKNCTFENIGGNIGSVVFDIDATTFTNQPFNLVVEGCTFSGTNDAVVCLFDNSAYSNPLRLVVANNSGTCAKFVNFGTKVYGATITGNVITTSTISYLTFNATDEIQDLVFSGNTIYSDNTGSDGFLVRSGNNISITGNTFKKHADATFLMGGVGATLDGVLVSGNTVDTSPCLIEWNGGTITNCSVIDNDASAASALFEGTLPSDLRVRGNKGYVSENGGQASVATGGTVSHGCAKTPTVVNVTSLSSTPTNVYVTSIGATTFAINFGGGGTNDFAWEAKIAEHFNS